MITSATFVASATVFTSKPFAAALFQDEPSCLKPTITSTPESLKFQRAHDL